MYSYVLITQMAYNVVSKLEIEIKYITILPFEFSLVFSDFPQSNPSINHNHNVHIVCTCNTISADIISSLDSCFFGIDVLVIQGQL